MAYSYKCNSKNCALHECGALEAKEKLKELILKKEVVLASDSQTNDKDIYGRLLRYILICTENCQDVSFTLLQEGLVREAGFGNKYSHQEEYKQAEAFAKNNKLGIWGSCQ